MILKKRSLCWKECIMRLDLLKTGLKEFVEHNARYAVNLDYSVRL